MRAAMARRTRAREDLTRCPSLLLVGTVVLVAEAEALVEATVAIISYMLFKHEPTAAEKELRGGGEKR